MRQLSKLARENTRWLSRLALCLVVLIVAALARSQNLSALHPFEADEKLWLLMGTSLLQTGTPASWTIYWDKYSPPTTIPLDGENELVVTPFLDHPPLFGLGVGLWATLVGSSPAQPLNWTLLRLPVIALSLAALVATFVFLQRLFNPLFAFLTLAAFATFPAHVISSRFIVAENLIAALLVACLTAFTFLECQNQDRERSRMSTMAAVFLYVICSIAILIKLSAIVIPATVGVLAILKKKWTVAGGILASSTLSVVALGLYGAHYDWSIFIDVLAGHSERPQSFWHFWSIITQLDLGYYALQDPSIIVGVLGLFAFLANPSIPWQKRVYLFVPLLNFSLLFLFIAPIESYGWYKYSLLPLIAIGIGYIFYELSRGKVVFYVLLLPWLAVMLEHSQLIASHAIQQSLVLVAYTCVIAALVMKQLDPRLRLLLPILFSVLVGSLFLLEFIWTSHLLQNAA